MFLVQMFIDVQVFKVFRWCSVQCPIHKQFRIRNLQHLLMYRCFPSLSIVSFIGYNNLRCPSTESSAQYAVTLLTPAISLRIV